MSDHDNGFMVLFFSIVVGVGLYSFFHFMAPQPPSQINRFQLIDTSHNGVFLLDSTSGENWHFVYTNLNKNGTPVDWEWQRNFNIEPPLK